MPQEAVGPAGAGGLPVRTQVRAGRGWEPVQDRDGISGVLPAFAGAEKAN